MTENAKRLLQRLYVRDDVCRMYNVGAMLPAMAYTPRTLDEIIAVPSTGHAVSERLLMKTEK